MSIPDDRHRVKLHPLLGDPNSDYINANYIDVSLQLALQLAELLSNMGNTYNRLPSRYLSHSANLQSITVPPHSPGRCYSWKPSSNQKTLPGGVFARYHGNCFTCLMSTATPPLPKIPDLPQPLPSLLLIQKKYIEYEVLERNPSVRCHKSP